LVEANPEETSATVLKAVQVSRRFGDILALNEVSLSVAKGQLYGLVGPDGAGKTTLVRALSGLIGIEKGYVEVFGGNPLTNSALRDRMGVMPQHYSLYGDLSVAENLKFFADLYCLSRKVYRERVSRLLSLTQLLPFTERRASALSGGMYKKLALACALLHEPKVLLLDEPTNGVDPVSRRELWQLLHEFVSREMAVFISTAYMDEAARCHEVCLLHEGKVIAQGPPRRLVNELDAKVFEVHGGVREQLDRLLIAAPGLIAMSPAGERLRVVVSVNDVPEFLKTVTQLGVTADVVTANFEDVFLAKTRKLDGKHG
jgi:ABC-2 type transport system ATP-binding protein